VDRSINVEVTTHVRRCALLVIMLGIVSMSGTHRRDEAENNTQQYRANVIRDGQGISQRFNSSGRSEEAPPGDTVRNIPGVQRRKHFLNARIDEVRAEAATV
jgi:hypothetical protein